MIYFCADDYGISDFANSRIENCLHNGILNKVSVLPNGKVKDFKNRIAENGGLMSLHLNLVEGCPLSNPKDIDMLLDKNGCFKYSFAGLYMLSLSAKRKKVQQQIYKELQSQIKFWKAQMGEDVPVFLDSHQHTHMIPLVFKTLMRVIKDAGLDIKCIRIPAEPVLPYLLTPSLYLSYSIVGLIKQWILKTFAFANRKELKKSGLQYSCFMGVMFSGKMDEKKIKKLLPHYLKLADKKGKDVEIGFHPGYLKKDEKLIFGNRKGFEKFYFSHWRSIEYDTLMNFKL